MITYEVNLITPSYNSNIIFIHHKLTADFTYKSACMHAWTINHDYCVIIRNYMFITPGKKLYDHSNGKLE